MNTFNREFPRKDDLLFNQECRDWVHNAVLNYGFNKLSFYADGYQQGAQVLVNQCLNDRGVNDIFVYPIIFLYRQYIELRLKELISGLHYCHDRIPTFPKHHKIEALWNEFVKLYEELGEDASEEEFLNTQKLINEFAVIDSDSFAFRYPEDKQGKKTLELGHINLRNVGEVMERMGYFLDAISDQIAHYKDLSDDMRRDEGYY